MRLNGPAVDVVIVDYNAGDQLRRCVASIAKAEPRATRIGRVVVVDNASIPPTAEVLGDAAPFTQLIRNNSNRGFAAACNQGAQGSVADYLLFLNPDTEVSGESLDGPVEFFEGRDNHSVAIVGIQMLDENHVASLSCVNFPQAHHFWNKALALDRLSPRLFPTGSVTGLNQRSAQTVDQVIGAFFFVRRSVFEELHGFDERFFLYFEETDFSLRAALAGYKSIFLPTVNAVHLGEGTTRSIKALRLFYSWRSRLAYAAKHFTLISLISVAIVTLTVEPITRMIATLLGKAPGSPSETAWAWARLWRDLIASLVRNLRRRSTLAMRTRGPRRES